MCRAHKREEAIRGKRLAKISPVVDTGYMEDKGGPEEKQAEAEVDEEWLQRVRHALICVAG